MTATEHKFAEGDVVMWEDMHAERVRRAVVVKCFTHEAFGDAWITLELKNGQRRAVRLADAHVERTARRTLIVY